MAVERRVTFLIGANIKNFTKGLNKAQRSFRRFGKDMQRAGSTLTRGLTIPLGIAGFTAVKTAAEYETLRQSIDILTGSAKEGARVFERLKQFSARTPFQLRDIAKANQTLMGFGQTADEAFESIQLIGDIAAVTGGDMQAISIAFGQAAAEGRLMTRDIRQLINQGVPAIQLLADAMGVATSDVLDLASQGEISFDILVDAFRKATSEGGMFADGMKKQSQTVAGLFSTLRDNASIALGELGDSIVDTFNLKEVMKALTKDIQGIVEVFKGMSKDSKAEILKVAGLFLISGPVVFAIGKFVSILGLMLGVFRKVMVGMVTIATTSMGRIGLAFMAGLIIGQHFVNNMKALFSGNFDEMNSIFVGWADAAVDAVQKVFGPIVELGDTAFSKLAEGIGKATGASEALANFFKLLEDGSRTTSERMDELNKRIASIANEISRTDDIEKIKKLTAQLEALRLELQKLQQQQSKPPSPQDTDSGGGLSREARSFFTPPDISVAANQFVRDLQNMRAATIEFGSVSKFALELAKISWQDFKDAFKETSDEIKAMLAQMFGQMAITLGANIGRALAGVKNQFATGFEQIILIVLDFAKQLASLLGLIGGALLFVPGMQGVGAAFLAAAVVLSGIATGFSAGINKRIANRRRRAQEDIPGMAHGGIIPPGFPNDTFPAMLSSGETVLPSPQALPSGQHMKISGEFRVKGTDLVLVLERAHKKFE